MTVNYKGSDKEYNYRVAEISFDENEEKKIERIAFAMSVKGWDINVVTDGYANCEVNDYEAYKMFMADWKECKRVITNCMKYGF